MAAIDRVRIMVLGDSGVGKTSFVHLVAHGEPLKAPSWTVGCNVELKLHEFKEGTPQQTTYFVEFWDVGGSHSHRNTRHVFYHPCHGVILIHDLTNKKSEDHLRSWFDEILNTEAAGTSLNIDEWDTESVLGTTHIPILLIGTKMDLVDEKSHNFGGPHSTLSMQLAADEIVLDTRQARYLAAGSSSAVKLSRFYDKAIEKRYTNRLYRSYSDKYSHNSISPNLSSKFYSPTHQD